MEEWRWKAEDDLAFYVLKENLSQKYCTQTNY